MNNSFCKEHSGFKARIIHLESENKTQWDKIDAVDSKTNKILNRLTTASITFALAAGALLINFIVGFLK